MSWWWTTGRIIVAAESLYGTASAIHGLVSSGATLSELRSVWWNALADMVCKYDLSHRELVLAIQPTLDLMQRLYGYVPDVFPSLTKENWKRLRNAGGCPPPNEFQEAIVSIATIGISIFIAWAIMRGAQDKA